MAVRASTYESILRGIANLAGIKRDSLQGDQAALIFEYINMALRRAQEYDWYPETVTVEKRYFRDGLHVVGGTYPDGSIVYSGTDEIYYENTSGGATTETPSSTAADWDEAGDFNRYVSLTQMTGTNLATAETEIDAVRAMYTQDPRINRNRGEVGFVITEDGVAPIAENFAIAWLEFRKRPDDMSGMVEWDATATYAVGEYIYYEGSTTPLAGEAYKVIVATNAGEDPQDTPASFQKVTIPYIFSTYIKHQALANWLGGGGGGTALGDSVNSVQLASWHRQRAIEELEDISFNLRARSGQYDNYVLRTN